MNIETMTGFDFAAANMDPELFFDAVDRKSVV